GIRARTVPGVRTCALPICPDRPRKVGSIGMPIWGVELKVISDSGETLGDGENGEICIRGHNVMKGYHNRPEATAETIDADGWLQIGRASGRGRGVLAGEGR